MSKDLNKSDSKRPTSSMSTGSSADSGVFSSGVHHASSSPSHSQPSVGSSSHSGPPSPTTQFNSLLFETANLMAVNEQLRKEIAENKQIQNNQMRALNKFGISNPVVENPIASLMSPLPQGFVQRIPRGERRMQKPESYKTVICQAWLESKMCTFAENCRFAHGEEELRPAKMEPRQNNKYKTKLCDKYTTTGLCPYGKRCLFIHPDHGPNAYIRADKLYEVSQRHALADLRDRMETQIMSGGPTVVRNVPVYSDPQILIKPQLSTSTPIDSSHHNRSTTINCDVRPPPSWPLESSSFFLPPENPMIINNNSIHLNPFDSSAFSPPSHAIQPYFVTAKQQNAPPQQFADDDSIRGGFDHLAEDMAKHLELW